MPEKPHKAQGETRHEGRRALVSLKRLGEIVKDLPNPNTCSERSYLINSGSVELKFERIKYIDSKGAEAFRWSYCSRIVI